MNITLNNRPEKFSESSLSISELLEKKNFTFKMLIIKVNGEVKKKEDYDKTTINDGDDVKVIHLIAGG